MNQKIKAQQAEQPAEEARGVAPHTHARIIADKLMAAHKTLGGEWNGALDDALNHADTLVALLAAPAAGTGQAARVAELVDVLRAVDEQFRRFGDRFPDGFDARVFRWVRDALAGTAPQAATGAQGLTDNQLDDIWHSTEEIAGTAFGMHRKFARAVLAKAAPSALSAAARDVLAERQRQIEVEGWTPEHDDEHTDGGLAYAAACYAMAVDWDEEDGTPEHWPWAPHAWNPKDERCNLVRAGALIQAEIERLDRAGLAASKEA